MRRTLAVLLAALTLAGAASAQTVWSGRGDTAGRATAEQLQRASRFTRGFPDPNAPPRPRQLVCAYRTDGQPISAILERGFPNPIVTCPTDQSSQSGSACVCNGRQGVVISVPVF